MNKLGTKFRFIGMIFFIIYLLVLCYFLFFAEAFGRGISLEAHGYNTTPFVEIRRYIDNFDKLGMITVICIFQDFDSWLSVFTYGGSYTAFDQCRKL